MGTNYYWIKKQKWMEELPHDFDESDSIIRHIGKRSAAGNYCKKCGSTLCSLGTRYIHNDSVDGSKVHWHNTCPVCYSDNDLIYITSFAYTFMRQKWEIEKFKGNPEKIIEDEYGEQFTADEFFNEISSSLINQIAARFC